MEVSTQHKFQDEWLAKALLDYQIIESDFLSEMRARHADQDYFIDVLVDNDHLTLEDISIFIENVLQIPYINLEDIEINSAAIEQVPESVCQKHQVFPFNMKEDHIAVAFTNPFDLEAEKELAYVTGKFVKTFFTFKEQVKGKIEEYYSPEKFIDNLVDRAQIESKVRIEGEDGRDGESPVIKLVSMVIGDAIEQEASDIHIEPKEKVVVVRYRIDGILRNILEVPKSVQASLISRVKIISNLNIAESRKPQDGKAKVIHEETSIDLRISILPTSFGEKVVIRILDNRKAQVSFPRLGVNQTNLKLLETAFSKTQGMLLVTGPTGSGKTTTLYAALNRIRNTANNILTIEDPIEYMVEGINQVQVNNKAGITFASALRSFLRQDPDVILVGEIRDQETAEIAIQAALTGHLVLSTLHTNDSLGTITRLVDMGVDVYKVASSLEAVLAQRLVRTLCPHCKEERKPDDVERNLIPFIERLGLEPKFFHARGCQKCGFSGYKGRIGVYEILVLSDELKDLIASGASIYEVRKAARRNGFKSLYEDALIHIAHGMTDYKEVMRVVSPDSVEEKKTTATRPVKTVAQKEPGEIAGGQPDVAANEESAPPVLTPPTAPTINLGEEILPDDDKPPVVLLVEDNVGTRKMIRLLIEKKTDWQLLEAEDGVIALHILNENKVDVVVSDVMMPNLDGYGLLEEMRKNLATATIPVLMLTALNGSDNEVKSLDLGADDYLSKPYNPNVLLARIKRLLRRVNNKSFVGVRNQKEQTVELKLV